MPQCSYCKKHYEIPRGLTFVLSNGEVLYFCSSKCKKNWNMGRRADKLSWITKRKDEVKVVEEKAE